MTKEFITKTDLISKRKWTDALLKKYMSEPDHLDLHLYLIVLI